MLPVVFAGERVPFAGLSPERVSPRPSSDLFCGLGLCALRCAARLEARRNTARINGVMDDKVWNDDWSLAALDKWIAKRAWQKHLRAPPSFASVLGPAYSLCLGCWLCVLALCVGFVPFSCLGTATGAWRVIP